MEPDPPPSTADGSPSPVGEALADARTVDRIEEDATLAAVEAAMFGEERRVRVGRYELGESLGRGGAGDVYLARDPELDREVAIKLLRPVPGERGERARRRFLREARSIARLSHPNVVEVFDAGDFRWSSLPGEPPDDDEGVFIVMERVRGRDLHRWLREEERSPDEILLRFMLAGQGLAAAHREGIVHRDFKPSNVLVSNAGSVKVADFGLALIRGVDESSDASTRHDRRDATPVLADGPLTETGTLMGTPAYMAPEQHQGRATDPRADQYAFCASLLGALLHRPPFVGDDLGQILEAKLAGPPPLPPGHPRRLARALARGLRPEPRERWPSMDALLDAMRPRSVRVRPLVALGLVTAGLAGALLLMPSRAPARACDPSPRIEAVWNDERREALATSLGESTVPFAATTHERLVTRLDAHTEAWGERYQEVCEDSDRDDSARDLHMLCLLRQLEQLDSLVGIVAEADPAVLQRALGAAAALPPATRCDEAGYVDAVVAPPKDRAQAGRVEHLREQLIQLETLEHLGRYRAGVVQARGIAAEAERLGHPPVLAHALLRLGSLQERAGDYEAANESLERAFFVAQGIPDPARAVEIATVQVHLHGHRLRSFEAAEQWVRHARAALDQRSDPDAESNLLDALATLDIDQRRYEDALARYREALALRREHADPLDLATAHNNIATAMDYLGQHQEALVQYDLALGIRREQLGETHPDVATVLFNMANSRAKLGDPEGGIELHREALAIREQSLGPTHLRTGHSLNNLASLLIGRGDLDEAQSMLERALAAWRASLDEDHPYIAGTTANLGHVQWTQGDLAGARRSFERALELARGAHGADPTQVVLVLLNLAGVLAELGEHEASIERYEEALALYEREPGPPETAGDLRLGLAMTLVKSGGDRDRARALAEQAIAHYEVAGSRGQQRLEETRQWLAELP